jgi:hypothetical protein
MGPDELALLQVLLQSGYTEEQAMQMLMQGSLAAPAVDPMAGVLGQMQQGVANNYATPPPSIGFTPPPSPPPFSTLGNADAIYEDGSSNLFSPPGLSDTGWQFPGGGQSVAPTPGPFMGTSMMGSSGWNPGNGFQGTGMPGDNRPPDDPYGLGGGVPVGGVNPNAYMEKERSYGGDMRDAQTYGRDLSGDLGSIIRELVNAGRSAAAQQRPQAQRNPSRPSSPGRSASAPGQMKKAAGVQSAKSFTPAATRASTPAPAKARTVTAPVTKPAAPKPPTPKGSVVATRGKAIANTITKPKSRF